MSCGKIAAAYEPNRITEQELREAIYAIYASDPPFGIKGHLQVLGQTKGGDPDIEGV